MKHLLGWMIFLLGSWAGASQGLVIYTAEFGVGKFHRYDNKVHAYPADSSWTPYILPDNVNADQTLTQKNADGSYTIFFSNLEDMVTSIVQVSQKEQKPISLLNIHGHGLPGSMWFPQDSQDLNGFGCYQWRASAEGSDEDNYAQYYDPVSASEVQSIRDMGDQDNSSSSCTTGLSEWQTILGRHPEFLKTLATDAQVSFLSCVVGLGHAGETFTQGIAQLLFPAGSTGQVQTSTNFGLGDWSMPQGMGFWDYISDQQIDHDDDIYPRDHKDQELAQKGTLRVAKYNQNAWTTGLVANQDFMIFNKFVNLQGVSLRKSLPHSTPVVPEVQHVRIPGTAVTIEVRH